MKKDYNMKVKKYLDIYDMANVVRIVSESYFDYDDKIEEKVVYTPHYSETATLICFYKYCVEGIDFEDDESIYHRIISDEELLNFYYENEDAPLVKKIKEYSYSIAQFKKHQILSQNADALTKLLNTVTDKVRAFDVDILTQFIKKFNESDISAKSFVNVVNDLYERK